MRLSMSGSPPSGVVPAAYRGPRERVAGVGALVFIGVVITAFVRYRPSRVLIEGSSMAPTLLPGDQALVVAARSFDRGDVVVVEHPGRPGYEMVKRLAGVPGDLVGERHLGSDEFWVLGDFPAASTDSRHFGTVTRAELRAKVVAVYWPASRRGAVR
jgi:nickel-type superoxide dismutase maturation protease